MGTIRRVVVQSSLERLREQVVLPDMLESHGQSGQYWTRWTKGAPCVAYGDPSREVGSSH